MGVVPPLEVDILPPTHPLHLLRFCCRIFQRQLYEQTDAVAMGSTLSRVIADFYMEYIETATLQETHYKPSFYKHYVDDTFKIWP